MNKANKIYLERLRRDDLVDRRTFDAKLYILKDVFPAGFMLLSSLLLIASLFKRINL